MKHNFIEKSIFGVLSFMKDSLFSEEYALRKGFLQSIDPRFKLLAFAAILIAVLFIKSIPLLLCLYLLCLLSALLSRIDLLFFLKRTWIFIPLFSLFIAIPALFDTFTPGEALFSLNFWGLKLIISRQGFFGAVLFVTRVVTSVSFVVLLGIVTRHAQLLSVLRIFKIPQVFVMTLSMCYRYIYLFVEIIENTYLAIKSRVGVGVQYEKGQRLVAWNIGSLWQRSSNLNEEVYKAMLSRGYSGEPVVFKEFRAGFKDWSFLCLSVLICAVLVYFANG